MQQPTYPPLLLLVYQCWLAFTQHGDDPWLVVGRWSEGTMIWQEMQSPGEAQLASRVHQQRADTGLKAAAQAREAGAAALQLVASHVKHVRLPAKHVVCQAQVWPPFETLQLSMPACTGSLLPLLHLSTHPA